MKKQFILSLILCIYLLFTSKCFAYEPDAVNYNNIGINFTKKADYPNAIINFKKAIESDSSLTNAYYNLGSVYKYTGETDKAINAFLLLLRNNPKDDEVAYLLAGLYFDKQDYDKALLYVNTIDKASSYYKDSLALFAKINEKINDAVIEEPVKVPSLNTSKLVFSGFEGPAGIATNSKGDVYVADFVANSIRVMTADGKPKSTIKNPLMIGPMGIAIDSNDNIYVCSYTSNNIVKIDNGGILRLYKKDVIKPYYLYFDKAGVLYVSEQGKNIVTRLGIPD
jgi:tetratricopeptide (TPR) repeat protein